MIQFSRHNIFVVHGKQSNLSFILKTQKLKIGLGVDK